MIDRDHLLDKLGSDQRGEVVKTFTVRLCADVAALEQRLAAKDPVGAAAAVHSIKGGAGAIGASALLQAACDFERKLLDGTSPTAKPILDLAAQTIAALR